MKSINDPHQEMASIMAIQNIQTKIDKLERLLSFTPDFASVNNELGILHYQLKNQDTALKYLEKAAQQEPANPKFQKSLADFYYSVLSRTEDALNLYEKALVFDPMNEEVLIVSANILVALGRFDDAQKKYERILSIEPWRMDIQECIDKLNKRAQEQNPGHIEGLYQQAQTLVQNNDIEKATLILEELLNHAPDYAVAHNDLGVLKSNNGDLANARYHYEKAVALSPENLIYLKNLAEYYLIGMGEIEKALEIYVKILTINPQDVEALMAAGTISEKFEQLDNARLFYEAILDAEPWHLEASDRLEELGIGASALKTHSISL